MQRGIREKAEMCLCKAYSIVILYLDSAVVFENIDFNNQLQCKER